MTNFQLQDVQKVLFVLNAVDADGNPAALASGASIKVSSADPTIADVVLDPTPASGSLVSGFVVGKAKLGTVQINAAVVNVDGSAGVTGAVSIDVVAGPAATISFNLGTPVSQ